MKTLLAALLGILSLSNSLLADGNWVYLSGTITRTVQSNNLPEYQTTTEKQYFLFNHTDDSYTRYRTFTQNGVKHYQNLGITALRGDVLPSSKTLKGSIYNYQLITASDPTRTITLLKGIPNAATGVAILSAKGPFPSSLSFASQNYIYSGAFVQRIEEKGTLTVLRPLSKQANAGTPLSYGDARQLLINTLANMGYQP